MPSKEKTKITPRIDHTKWPMAMMPASLERQKKVGIKDRYKIGNRYCYKTVVSASLEGK